MEPFLELQKLQCRKTAFYHDFIRVVLDSVVNELRVAGYEVALVTRKCFLSFSIARALGSTADICGKN